MKIYKFGGASVKNADGIRNLAKIANNEKENLFIIVSAMGKTTNALEKLLDSFYDGDTDSALNTMQEIICYHNEITEELWGKPYIPERVARFYSELKDITTTSNPGFRDYEVWYDRIVSYGELISTAIISEYLAFAGTTNNWVDMRECFVTSSRHKDANVDLDKSTERLLSLINSASTSVFVGQGFIGATEDGSTTTIGREGSDYSAAVAGYILDAHSVTIWKDVCGILNGDPKIFPDARHIPEMNYLDAIELAYSGAQVIHPKTIKPLQNKDIPLHVRSFIDPTLPGSVIKDGVDKNQDIPILILKRNQLLLTIRALDLSFILEERFAQIFELLNESMVKVNLIQSSAVNLDLCIDKTRHIEKLIERLQEEGYHTAYNADMELLTIRNYTPQQQKEYGDSTEVYLTQRTRRNLLVVRKAQ